MSIGSSVLKKVGNSILNGGKVNKASKFGAGVFGVDTAMNVYSGDDIGTSVAKAGVTGLISASNPGLFFVGTAASLAQEGYWGLQQFNYQKK
ncbi:hypothetical protein P4T62_28665, partial [Bacillus mycoides]|nr:hypothetical protein [Bacillus mycoides]